MIVVLREAFGCADQTCTDREHLGFILRCNLEDELRLTPWRITLLRWRYAVAADFSVGVGAACRNREIADAVAAFDFKTRGGICAVKCFARGYFEILLLGLA